MKKFFFVITLVLMAVRTASAVPPNGPPRNPLKRELARRLYKLGETYYKTGDYQQAKAHFEKAHKVEPAPALLYNIGRCHELLGQLADAIATYETYLSKVQGPGTNRVRLLLKNLRQRLKQQQPADAVEPATRPATVEPTVREGPEPSRDGAVVAATPSEASANGTMLRVTGWSLLGVGAATLTVSLAFAIVGSKKATEYDEEKARGATYQKLSSIEQSGDRSNAVVIASLVAGGVLAAAGGVLLWLGSSRGSKDGSAASEARRLGLWLNRSLVGMSARVHF